MKHNAKSIAVKWYATADDYAAHKSKCEALGISQSQALNQSAHQWLRQVNSTRPPGRNDRPKPGPHRTLLAPGTRGRRGGAPMFRISI